MAEGSAPVSAFPYTTVDYASRLTFPNIASSCPMSLPARQDMIQSPLPRTWCPSLSVGSVSFGLSEPSLCTGHRELPSFP